MIFQARQTLPARNCCAAANINPRTGLATDYLNHFNEAIMLLEMIPDLPDCTADFPRLAAAQLSRSILHRSCFSGRDLAIDAYDSADPVIRTEFDNITASP